MSRIEDNLLRCLGSAAKRLHKGAVICVLESTKVYEQIFFSTNVSRALLQKVLLSAPPISNVGLHAAYEGKKLPFDLINFTCTGLV